MRAAPARVAASVQYLQPVIGIGASAYFFGEKLGLFFAIGSILILCGLALTMAPGAKRPTSG